MKKRPLFVPKVPRVPVLVFLDVIAKDDITYIPPEETDEERWGREYDEENPDPFEDESCCEEDGWDQVEDWEMLGMDGDSTQEEIDDMWESQM